MKRMVVVLAASGLLFCQACHAAHAAQKTIECFDAPCTTGIKFDPKK